MGSKDLRSQLLRLNGNAEPEEERPVVPESYRVFYSLDAEWGAFAVVRGFEPSITMDPDGALWSRGGETYIGTPDRMVLHWLRGEKEHDPNQTQEWWDHFLLHDQEAADLVQQLRQLADVAPAPEDWYGDLSDGNTKEEATDKWWVYEDETERERVRKLGWAIQYMLEARQLFARLTQRRDQWGHTRGWEK